MGGVLFFGGRPPKVPTFSGSGPERLERGPQHSACRRNFQKSLRKFVVLRIGYNLREKSAAHLNTRGAPTKKQKSAVFACFGAVFNQMVGAMRIFT